MKNRFLIIFLFILVYSSCTKDKSKEPLPIAHFTITGQDGFVALNEILFTNFSENAESYSWDFGDGNISIEENPSHKYIKAGKYKVILTALNAIGSDTMSMNLNIETKIIKIEDNLNEPTIDNGLHGFVIEFKGDFMPGTENPGTIDSISSEIYIYESLTSDVIRDAMLDGLPFYNVDSIKQKPIAIVTSNNLGFYEIELEAGDYSGFVKVDDYGLYDNSGTTNIQIEQSQVLVERNFVIDYEASE